ncbi:hypothetical protein QBC37DRAFT_399668 [Rhypophila decipiens]|uniref:Uncharacterized protein n=1 Tax=Rhypophila decipiens TaxID=261697 RepID=A0AAN6Y978_9PEZI|nr:hypothetical protein QBC37DRAFT_399668 [Rhypophila decipiens]
MAHQTQPHNPEETLSDVHHLFSEGRATSHESDNHQEQIERLISSRCIQGRIPFREDGNPKGKHPRKPFPWRLKKLRRISAWEAEATAYRESMWREQREQERRERMLARGKTPDGNDGGFRGRRPPNLKKTMVKIMQKRKAERKRVSRTNVSHHQGPTSQTVSVGPAKTNEKNRKKIESLQKTNRKWQLKPHYLTALDAAAKAKGRVCYAYGCDYCEDRHRKMKATRYNIWSKEAVLHGVELIAEHDHLVEAVRMEIEESSKLAEERMAEPHQQICMDDIVRLRQEEPGYVVRYRLGRKKQTKSGGGKERVVVEKGLVAVDNSGLFRYASNRIDMGSEDDWEDLECDISDGSGSMWIEVISDDGKVQ